MHLALDPFDLASLFALRDLLDGLDPSGEPVARTLTPARAARSVAILPGSFNPPTTAHLVLADRAIRAGHDLVVLLLARSTVGKQQSGLILEDRLLAMRAAAASHTLVAACSHGLYADQAEAVAAAFPGADLTFLVGSDKVEQIFEHRWYRDRDAALDRLFSLARVVAAPRGPDGERLRAILDAEPHRRWTDRIEVMRLHPSVGDLSSTRVRGLLRSGAEPQGLVPDPVAAILSDVRAFAPPVVVGSEEIDLYALRVSVFQVLCRERPHLPARLDVRALLRAALAPTDAGRRFRHALSRGDACADDVVRAQRAVAT